MASCIYFVKDTTTGNIKIGYSSSLRSRLSNIRSQDGSKAELLALIPGDKADENHYHTKFYHDHVIGDWYKPSENLTEFINELVQKTPKEDFLKLLEKSSRATVTVSPEQYDRMKEVVYQKAKLATGRGSCHGDLTRWVEAAIDEKLERDEKEIGIR